MKRTSVVTWAIMLFVIIIPLGAFAATPTAPHYDSATGPVKCTTCHTASAYSPASGYLGTATVSSPVFYNNMCQSCHRSGDAHASNKPLSAADASVVFGSHTTTNTGSIFRQTSHRWDGSLYNPAAGAEPPTLGLMTSTYTQGTQYKTNLTGRTGGQLACVRCHSVHLPTANNSFTRIPNDQDQMCMDCHKSRAQTSHESGTHPVNINYAAKAAASLGTLKSSIQNAANNATSDLNSYLTQTAPSGNIVCSTCHSPHYADSRSSTFDGASSAKGRGSFANLSTGDGNILRTDRRGKKVTSSETYAGNDKLNICTNCHANKKSHNAGDQDVQCNDCHGAHVQFDATSSVQSSLNPNHLKNVYLIRRNASKAGVSTKIFFRYTGTQREYKNANGTGVCQGCHDVPAPGGTSPSGSTYPPEHDNTLAKDCNACHSHGSQAGSFSGACGKCHGNPPIDAAGMAQPATGVLPAGQWGSHEIHAKTRKMSCNTCHDGYVDRATMPSNTIDMGFAINGGNFPAFKANTVNGQYNTSASLISKFSGTGAAVGTDSTCSNVYCHGATLTPGAVSQPYWISTDNESNYGIPAGTCSACHETAGNYLTMGSHVVHAGSALGFACANCHGAHDNNDHVNGSVSWSFDAGTMGASAKYKTPSGAYATSGETGRLAPSSANAGYGTCDNIVCHGASSAHNLPWGGTLWAAKGVAGETCAKCHSSFKSYSTTKAFYSTSYPTQVTASSDLKVGAHAVHLKGKHTSDNACAVCHGTVTTLNHMTGTTSFSWSALASSNGAVPTYSSSAGTCSNYCHGAKMPNGDTSGSLRTPTWTASFLGTVAACGKCHGAPPTSHGGINTPTSFAEVATYCSGCHPEVINSVPGSTYDTVFKDKSLHVNGKVEGGGCNGCHGYPPSRKGFTGTTGSYEFARAENYSSGGGAHTVQGHVPAAANASEGWVNCSKCHKQDTNHPSRTGGFLPSSNIKVEIDQKYRFSNSKNTPQAKYSSSRLDGAAHVAGRCNNISCHFQKTPKW